MSEPSASARTNRLAGESSPYLRQHARNPVDWYPWGDEALARSRAEHKPILLSIGYSACHWCHVMAHESFENEAIAKRMNEFFINVKVDREERPDLDQLYQGVVVLMGRGGGWPLTVFLTPELKPFFGGTYFPPEDRFGMPAFPKMLTALHDAWVNKPDDIAGQAKQFETGLQYLATHGLDAAPSELSVRDIAGAGQKLEREIDRTHGGFGSAPKFPNPMNLSLLLRAHRRSGIGSLLTATQFSLEKMATGGIYDQLGGGFHRYSVDERWRVPHFEKMLYDNAQLLHLYSEAQQLMPSPLWKGVVEETVEYVRREMTAPNGGFYATQDADSEGEEGKFFVWTPALVDAELSKPDAALAKLRFGITEAGNFEHGHTVLEVAASAQEIARQLNRPIDEIERSLSRIRAELFTAREKRVKPGRDEKILAGWNGLTVRGLAFAGRVFNRREWIDQAKAATDFLLEQLWKGGRLFRCFQDGTAKIDGFVEDYGGLCAGLVALYQACFDPKYLEAAEAISARAIELFWDPQRSAYLSAPKGQKDLICSTYALHDNATPSGASLLTEAHVALAALTGKTEYLEQANRYLARMRDEITRNPFGYGHLFLTADSFLEGAAEVSIAGDRAQLEPMIAVVNSTYAPTIALLVHESGSPVPAVVAEVLKGREPMNGQAAAYLCRRFVCEAPVTDPAELKGKLTRLGAVPITAFTRPKA